MGNWGTAGVQSAFQAPPAEFPDSDASLLAMHSLTSGTCERWISCSARSGLRGTAGSIPYQIISGTIRSLAKSEWDTSASASFPALFKREPLQDRCKVKLHKPGFVGDGKPLENRDEVRMRNT